MTTYLNAALGLAVLVLLGVLMVGLNGLARDERRRPERRPARPHVASSPAPEEAPEALAIAEPAELPNVPLFDVEEQEPVDRSAEDTSRRRRSGISPDALEELLDL
jgi:hypothetical protein